MQHAFDCVKHLSSSDYLVCEIEIFNGMRNQQSKKVILLVKVRLERITKPLPAKRNLFEKPEVLSLPCFFFLFFFF